MYMYIYIYIHNYIHNLNQFYICASPSESAQCWRGQSHGSKPAGARDSEPQHSQPSMGPGWEDLEATGENTGFPVEFPLKPI